MLADPFAANAWSGRNEAHDSFSYWDDEGLYLESRLRLPAAVLLPEFLDERSGVATNALFAAAFANRSMTREPVR
jgi:hypothetical protein